ncbi:hypothetical protein SCP_0110100 [Sparassis crispa]|uniref:SAGA-associated factor 11 n=1 Tax=Sparassis crispa TaxID=139825 RepID=A0A401G7J4_9APHY|nr:hypothetical protein SCP_0110100 [Sparassis crispa]GBE78127.1 hypothetical protein SCP_0110100 [Sparassis crispa]
MLEDILMDVVLESHQQIARSRAICDICHTRCNAVHVPGPSNPSLQAGASSSRVASPAGEGKSADANGSAGTGTSTPLNGNGKDGTVYLECLNCKRQIASTRYATHLSSCLGLANSRRGAARNATTKAKLASDAGRSASPYLESEVGNISDDGKTTTKGKGKSKAKRTDEAEFSLNRKRPGSPSVSPSKKQKKAKISGSPIARAKVEPDGPGSPSSAYSLPISNSQSKIPSRLRESSIASSFYRERHSSSPGSPSPGSSPARSISTAPSAPSTHSPSLVSYAAQKSKPRGGKGPRAPVKQPNPPLPPPPIIRVPEPDYLVGAFPDVPYTS